MCKITVSDYLIQELSKLGIKDFFGLPGDYNFNILGSIENNPDTNWIGCTNELNAGYAADGYARINGYGALVTTFGVGELSAMNAIAGSFAENIPVFKIVGVPATKYIEQNTLLHHNFSNPDYFAFQRAYANVVEATAFLDCKNAKKEIDRLLQIFVREKKPVYIAIPVDICKMEIENNPEIEQPASNQKNLAEAAEHALNLIKTSDFPVILADVLAKRFNATDEMKKFADTSGLPLCTMLMGKSLIDEDNEMYLGTYLGSYDNLYAYKYVNNSDCVISIGTIISDLNTFSFDIKFDPSQYINIQGTYTIIENKKYENVLMKDILAVLCEKIEKRDIVIETEKRGFEKTNQADNSKLTADYIYPRLQEFFKPGDIIFSETGLTKFGIAPMNLPKDCILNNQVLWGSIGWATPAAFGAAVADKTRRVVLLTGEGAHQLTAQEVSTIMRHNLKMVIIVLNNSGYTIERILSDNPMDKYNDIANWNYSKLPSVFEGDCWSASVRTEAELDEILKQTEIEQKDRLCYIELFTEMMDVPYLTKRVVKKLRDKSGTSVCQVR